jgi:conjugal transfer pilus assembly protein TraF
LFNPGDTIFLLKTKLSKGAHMFLLVLVFLLFSSPCFGKSIWYEHERGWFWYEVVPEKKAEKKKPEKKSPARKQKKAISYAEMLKEIRAELDEIRARAILFPTPENVAAWYRAQLIMAQLAGTFTKEAVLIPVLFPELDIASELGGASQLGMETVSYIKRAELQAQLKSICQNSVLLLIYRSPGCFLCERQAEEILRLRQKLGFKVYALYEGAAPDGVDRARPLTEKLSRLLNVKVFPTVFLFRDGQLHYLGSGFLGQQDLERRILLLAQNLGWIQAPDLFLTAEHLTPEQALKEIKKLKEQGYQRRDKSEKNPQPCTDPSCPVCGLSCR